MILKDSHCDCDKSKDSVHFCFKEFSLFFNKQKSKPSLWLSVHWGLVPQWGWKLQIRNINTNKQPHLWSIKAFQPLKQHYFCYILPLPNFKGVIKGNCYAYRISSRLTKTSSKLEQQISRTEQLPWHYSLFCLYHSLRNLDLLLQLHWGAWDAVMSASGSSPRGRNHCSKTSNTPNSRKSWESELAWLFLVPYSLLFYVAGMTYFWSCPTTYSGSWILCWIQDCCTNTRLNCHISFWMLREHSVNCSGYYSMHSMQFVHIYKSTCL